LDGVGDRCSGAIATAHEGQVTCHKFIEDPNRHSVGFFWALITNVIGYQHLEEAYKTMGLASLGKPLIDLSDALFLDLESGMPQLNSRFVTDKQRFISKHPEEPVFTSEFLQALSLEPRIPDSQIREIDKDLAASAQAHLEVVIKKFVNHWLECTDQHNLILTGGVALNSKLCGYLIKEAISTHIFVPQCPSDGNLALGAALCAVVETEKTMTATKRQILQSVSASIQYDEVAIHHAIQLSGYYYTKVKATEVSNLLAKNQVVAFFWGESEFGPRALGRRSILANPRLKDMKEIVNATIKFRESYRPFAPVVRDVDACEYFELGNANFDYMNFVVPAREKAHQVASAVVHFDGTSRVQVLKKESSPPLYEILSHLAHKYEQPILLNTSFNLAGEPIVESPTDAIRTFAASGLRFLYLQGYLLEKN
jgi:carbamoyltransferase